LRTISADVSEFLVGEWRGGRGGGRGSIGFAEREGEEEVFQGSVISWLRFLLQFPFI
jgi:hypothetical protein